MIFQKNAEFFWPKKYPSPVNAEDFEKKKKKKLVSIGEARSRAASFTLRRSTHYSIWPSLDNDLKIAYITKTQNIFFELEKKLINKICR